MPEFFNNFNWEIFKKPNQSFRNVDYDPNAELNWDAHDWLSQRAENDRGPKYTEQDVKIFNSHVPEYKQIEQNSKSNGTWLQMPDGSRWVGDPREWVMMQSEAFKKNYQENPWYTGQAEWETQVTLPNDTVIDTDKVKRARYHNGEMWFSNDAGYAQYFADTVGRDGLGVRGRFINNPNYKTDHNIKGTVFLAGIPKTGNYRKLEGPKTGYDHWRHMPFTLTETGFERTNEKTNLLTDDLVSHSRKLGDDGLFLFNVNDGPVLRNKYKENKMLPYFARPGHMNNDPNSRLETIPINEFISQPGFTEKIKFIRGNNGNFDPNTNDKYSTIFKIDSPLFAKKGGSIHIKKKNRGSFTRWCKGKVTEECIRRGKNSSNPAIRKKATFAANARAWKHENGGIIKYQNPSAPLLNPHKIIENIPAREWGPRKINEDYSITEGKGTNFWRAPFQYLGNKGLGVQNEKLARDLISEFDQMRSENPDYNYTLDKNYQSYDDAINYINHLEGLKKYLHLPYDTGLLMESKYKPTRLQGTNEKTYKFRSSMTPGYWNDVVDDMVFGEHSKNQYYDQSLNEFTAYRDRDEKGDFISIYDEWDYNPAVRGGNKKLNKVIDSVTGGKPFVIYDRVYLDDYYDIPEEARGKPFITPAVVTANEKHENGGILKAQEGTGNGFWSKLWNAVKAGGMAARDAKLGAVGAQQVRDLYSEGKNQEAQDLAKQYAKANTTGIALAGGAASTGLLGDLLVTGATTAADTFIDGNTKNFGKNLSINTAFDLAGHGVGKLLGNVNWNKVRNAGKLFSKSRIDPIFINGKISQAGVQEGLFGGKRSAESFMGSQTYKDAVAHDIALAKRAFGYDINPVVDDRYIKMPVKVEGASLGPHDAGIMYPSPNTNNPADDRILVDVGKHKTVNDLAATIFHENLHHGRFKTIDPQGNTIFTEIYHPERINPTLDFYRWKLKHLFKPEVEIPQELLDHYKYLTSVEIPHNEGATNVLELGFLGNTRAKSGYPGAQEVQRILDEVRKAYPQHAYTIDLLNMKKPKRVWEAMTGQYEDGGKLTDDDYRERIKKFLLWRTVGSEESTYIKNFKM